jgi:hypothetical protein
MPMLRRLFFFRVKYGYERSANTWIPSVLECHKVFDYRNFVLIIHLDAGWSIFCSELHADVARFCWQPALEKLNVISWLCIEVHV